MSGTYVTDVVIRTIVTFGFICRGSGDNVFLGASMKLSVADCTVEFDVVTRNHGITWASGNDSR